MRSGDRERKKKGGGRRAVSERHGIGKVDKGKEKGRRRGEKVKE